MQSDDRDKPDLVLKGVAHEDQKQFFTIYVVGILTDDYCNFCRLQFSCR